MRRVGTRFLWGSGLVPNLRTHELVVSSCKLVARTRKKFSFTGITQLQDVFHYITLIVTLMKSLTCPRHVTAVATTAAEIHLDKSNDEWSFIIGRQHTADITGIIRDVCHVNIAMSAHKISNCSSIGIFTFDLG